MATSLFSQSSAMGVLSYNLKPNFLGLLKFINSMNWFIVLLSLISLSECIYEDQIGKFDWRQTYVGRIKLAQFDTASTAKKIIVATEENVLAALHLKTGQIVWRHMLEGNIQMLYLSSQSAITEDQAVTVSGTNPYIVRGWDLASGILLWEWSITLQDESAADFSEWWLSNVKLRHLLPKYGSHLEVTSYVASTGSNDGKSHKIPAAWINEGCIFTAPYYTCVSGEQGGRNIVSFDVSADLLQLLTKPLSNFVSEDSEGLLRPLDGHSLYPGFILDDSKIIIIQNYELRLLPVKLADPTASVTIIDSTSGPMVLQAWSDDVKGFTLKAQNMDTGDLVPDMGTMDHTTGIPDPEINAALCSRARDQLACRVVLTSADDGLHLMQQGGKVVWTREESLANVVAVEFVDLPVSDLDAAIESEFDQKEGSIWAAFTRRVSTQISQLRALYRGETSSGGPEPLVRDYFNLHKLLVLVTDCGKIFGIDNLTGAILWKRYEPNLDTDGVLMFTRRTARHPPLDAYLTVVGKHVDTGNGLIISLNPIDGTLVGEKVLPLDTQLLQCALLHKPDQEKLHALILLDKDEAVQILPGSAAPLVENIFIYVAERNTANVQGYAIKYNGKEVVAEKTWSLQLGGSPSSGHHIVAVAARGGGAQSAGKVLGDRSVLYKYLNPNLVLFVSEGPDPLHKDVVVATCVDAVSGAVVFAQVHRRARALPAAVAADNFLAYLYVSDKHRRPEIATIELYEGENRWLPAGAAFSSLTAVRTPLVERAAYIIPATPRAAAVTVTERALTDKHVLLALSTGAIIEMPWVYLEPRRPVTPTPEQREEGLIPYAPELPLPPEAVINYNQTLLNVRAIYTAPSGLESTSLVLATGLDLFYTRVAPSKTFDLLKDDFDYSLISIVLAALLVATYSTKYFASRKMLRQAWK